VMDLIPTHITDNTESLRNTLAPRRALDVSRGCCLINV
jgi:hypothetical protein